MNCVFHLKYIILQHIIQKYPLPQTKKDTEKIVIYSSLKTIFSMKVCYREQIGKKCLLFCHFINMSQQIVINLSDIATQFGIIY